MSSTGPPHSSLGWASSEAVEAAAVKRMNCLRLIMNFTKQCSPVAVPDYHGEVPEFLFYEPSKGHRLPHDPFKAIVAPRPIGWLSTRDAEGRVNLAPYSFFNAVCDRPPMVMFSSSGWKDTVANIKTTGEFVCNFVTWRLAERMNQTS